MFRDKCKILSISLKVDIFIFFSISDFENAFSKRFNDLSLFLKQYIHHIFQEN